MHSACTGTHCYYCYHGQSEQRLHQYTLLLLLPRQSEQRLHRYTLLLLLPRPIRTALAPVHIVTIVTSANQNSACTGTHYYYCYHGQLESALKDETVVHKITRKTTKHVKISSANHLKTYRVFHKKRVPRRSSGANPSCHLWEGSTTVIYTVVWRNSVV
jgi:hypothetical protein